jgi:hypothetical protein
LVKLLTVCEQILPRTLFIAQGTDVGLRDNVLFELVVCTVTEQ